MRILTLLFSISLALARIDAAELAVSTDFPGGSAEVIALDAAKGLIHITPKPNEGRGWPCWWYFRVDGAVAGQKLTLQVGATPKPFRLKEVLAASWALPERAALSVDDVAWKHTEAGSIKNGIGTYEIVAPGTRFWMAWGPPFVSAHADALLDAIAKKVPDAERFDLAKTLGGRMVKGIRIGRQDAKQAVWVQARQHAWESGGSWVARGFAEWLAGNDAGAIAMRERAAIYFVPIMDVDNVSMGAGGKESSPRDHNRDWSEIPVYPEVAAAQRRIQALGEAGRLSIFMDLHNPGPGDKRPYFYGPLDYQQLSQVKRRRYDRFLDLAKQSITEPLALVPQYKFATYVKTEEERARVSGAWVRMHGGEKAVALCLETPWNTSASTTEGYMTVGRQLGQAMSKYLAENEQ